MSDQEYEDLSQHPQGFRSPNELIVYKPMKVKDVPCFDKSVIWSNVFCYFDINKTMNFYAAECDNKIYLRPCTFHPSNEWNMLFNVPIGESYVDPKKTIVITSKAKLV